MRRGFSTEILLPSVILICTLGVATVCYSQIRAIELTRGAAIATLQSGASYFRILHRGSCVGSLTLNAEKQKGYSVDGSGEFRALRSGTAFVVKFGLSMVFNPLGQLTSSWIEIAAPPIRAQLQTKEVNPIKLDFSLQAPPNGYQRSLSLPGPLQLRENASVNGAAVQFELVHALNLANLSAASSLTPMLNNALDIQVTSSTQQELNACAGQSMEISDLVKALGSLPRAIDHSTLEAFGLRGASND